MAGLRDRPCIGQTRLSPRQSAAAHRPGRGPGPRDIADRLARHGPRTPPLTACSAASSKVLLALYGDDLVPMSEVAARLDCDASNLTPLVERLLDRGLLDRGDDPADRRRRTLRLTEAGREPRDEFWSSLTTGAGPRANMNHTDLRRLDALLRSVTNC